LKLESRYVLSIFDSLLAWINVFLPTKKLYRSMFGFINLNKPTDFTSHDCVAKLRRLLNTKKIGHGGTLDPTATGVLPIAVGKATRLLQFLPEPKSYRARIRLGVATTTDDLEGTVIQREDQFNLDKSQITASLNSFVGEVEQVPPIYSAIKKNGKKLYELARKGEEVEIEPRTVNINKN
jgi:tRNA pseudouridine55 synthase